jgi:hypothetical protein
MTSDSRDSVLSPNAEEPRPSSRSVGAPRRCQFTTRARVCADDGIARKSWSSARPDWMQDESLFSRRQLGAVIGAREQVAIQIGGHLDRGVA